MKELKEFALLHTHEGDTDFVNRFTTLQNCIKAAAHWRRNYPAYQGEFFVRLESTGETVWREGGNQRRMR